MHLSCQFMILAAATIRGGTPETRRGRSGIIGSIPPTRWKGGEAIGSPRDGSDAHDPVADDDPLAPLAGPVRDWFAATFPGGPTPAQRLAWPPIAAGEHLLLVSPTGTGKTLAAFLAILDRLFREHAAGTLAPGLRCVYVSPLRSLGYDIERNLSEPLEAIRRGLGLDASPVTVGVRTGDTSAAPAPEAARRAAAPADHDAREPVAAAQPAGLARALARRPAPDRRRGPRAGADQARGRPGRLARAAVGAGRARPEPGRAVGDLPARRAGRAVPGRADADLPGRRGPAARRARRRLVARGRVAAQGRRGARIAA